MTQNVGAYRTSENPHKKAYDRERRVERLLKRAPQLIRTLRADLYWWSQLADKRADRADELKGQLGRAEEFIRVLVAMLTLAIIAVGGLWMRTATLYDRNVALSVQLYRGNTRLEQVSEERDIARAELAHEREVSRQSTRRAYLCRRQLEDTRTRVDELMSMADAAIARLRLNEDRIDVLERDCGLR
jgi:hypothetical protein